MQDVQEVIQSYRDVNILALETSSICDYLCIASDEIFEGVWQLHQPIWLFLLKNNRYALVRSLLKESNYSFFDRVLRHMPDQLENILQELTYEELSSFALNGRIDILDRLMALFSEYPSLKRNMFVFMTTSVFENHFIVFEKTWSLFGSTDYFSLIKKQDYALFINICILGRCNMLRLILDSIKPRTILKCLKALNYKALICIGARGHDVIFDNLLPFLPQEECIALFSYNRYHFCFEVVSNGHVNLFQKMMALLPEELREKFVREQSYLLFRKACLSTNLEMLDHILGLYDQNERQSLVKSHGWHDLNQCVVWGGYPIFMRVAHFFDEVEQKTWARSCHFELFKKVFECGDVELFQAIWPWISDIEESAYGVMFNASMSTGTTLEERNGFVLLCERGDEAMLDVLWRHLSGMSSLKKYLLQSHAFAAFRAACRTGRLSIVQKLYEWSSMENQTLMLSVKGFDPLVRAIGSCDTEVVSYLVARLISKKIRIPQKIRHKIFHMSYQHYQKKTLLEIQNLFSEPQRTQLIASDDYKIFRTLCRQGDLESIRILWSWSTKDAKLAMVKAKNFLGFRHACCFMKYEIVEFILHAYPKYSEAMFSANCFDALIAFKKNHAHMWVYRALLFPSVFVHAEMHPLEYQSYLDFFIKLHLEKWRAHVLGSLEPQELDLACYILRYFIRQKNEQHTSSILFLMSTLEHYHRLTFDDNALLKLAMHLKYHQVVYAFMRFESVRSCAERDSFYDLMQEGFDLSFVAKDPESSMRAPTLQEKHRLKLLERHYCPILLSKTVFVVMDELRALLSEHYIKKPATCLDESGTLLSLPLTWDAFEAMHLNEDIKQLALKAYYRHQVHTAYRWISKPNFWLDPSSLYIYVDESEIPHRYWSRFEDFQYLVALLYLAASDPSYPPEEGTLMDRVDYFVSELALIGRAHNWDATRVTRQGFLEQYDDEQADKPTCYSGTEIRLRGALRDHALYQGLTLPMVHEEMKDFIRASFKAAITPENLPCLIRAWTAVIEDGRVDRCWDVFNISFEAQCEFINILNKKYHKVFEKRLDLLCSIFRKFDHPCHAMHFSGWVYLEKILMDMPIPEVVTQRIEKILSECGVLGSLLQQALSDLSRGCESRWPKWRGAFEKYQSLMWAIEQAPALDETTLRAMLQDDTSALSLAWQQQPLLENLHELVARLLRKRSYNLNEWS